MRLAERTHVGTSGALFFLAVIFVVSALPALYLVTKNVFFAKIFGAWILMGGTLAVVAFVLPMLLSGGTFSGGVYTSPIFGAAAVSVIAGGYYIAIGLGCAILYAVSSRIVKIFTTHK